MTNSLVCPGQYGWLESIRHPENQPCSCTLEQHCYLGYNTHLYQNPGTLGNSAAHFFCRPKSTMSRFSSTCCPPSFRLRLQTHFLCTTQVYTAFIPMHCCVLPALSAGRLSQHSGTTYRIRGENLKLFLTFFFLEL